MSENEISLEVGKTYISRNGIESVKIITKIGPYEFGLAYRGDNTMVYRHDGCFLPDGSPTNYDLVREVTH